MKVKDLIRYLEMIPEEQREWEIRLLGGARMDFDIELRPDKTFVLVHRKARTK